MALTKIGILRNFLSTGIDDNANALALTLDTDENATFANGVTASSFAGDGSNLTGLPGGGISYVTKTANYTASNDEGIIADTSGGSFTVTLPASPSAGDQVYIADPANWNTNNLTVARNGSTIESASEDFTVDIGGIIVGFLYDGSTWQVYPQSGFASYQSLDSVLTIGSTTSQSLTVGELTVSGNLQVDGTTTTINSTTLTVDDKNIVLASGAADAAAADGSGITIDGASATLTYGSTNDAWSFNKDLGIGVANPAQRLDVREEKTGGGVLVQIYNEDNSDTTTQTAGIAMGPDTRGGTARITAVKENASFATNAGRDVALTFSSVLNNSPTERMRIDSSGDLSVGSASNHAGARVVINDTPPTAFGSPMFQVGQETFTASGYYSIGLGYTAGSYTNPPAEIAAVSTSSSGGTTAEIIFGTRSVTTNTAVTERMRIDASGNVGIGETNPSQKLHLSDPASGGSARIRMENSQGTFDLFTNGNQGRYAADSHVWYSSDTATVYQTIDSSGNVGIGTTSPASGRALTLNNASNYYGLEFQVGGTSKGRIIQEATGNMYYDANANMVFRTNTTTERMRIDSSGNVGIGTTSPGSYHSLGSQLVVAASGDAGMTIASGTANDGRIFFADGTSGSAESEGTIRYDHSDNSMHFSTADTVRLSLDSSGSVGIGAASPASQSGFGTPLLEVRGSSGGSLLSTNSTTGLEAVFVAFSTGINISSAGAATASTGNNIVFRTGNTNSDYNSTERMRIASNGIVSGLWADNTTHNASGKFVKMTQAQYNAITPDSNTIYFIT